MLQIRDICKEYRTGSLVQKALDQVSLNLRDNEFVAILGPSGSGKTTLLNIIGGLDRYDSGDLIINGISTKKYKDRDWDSYRNHTIGFVFQSYNLIPHQTILSNVELALTISGIGKSERRERAKKALDQVGLGEQVHKKPNQLSGGQMQRVAIARALVNDPEILLADEPTGALDSETSVQVMELLKEVARDRLVVMVTHNPELAHEYATRIVNLKDGKIRSDSDPFMVNEQELEEPEHKNMGKASMSFLTALSLSFNNLKTKKARTLLTSFAGSIGIIGIALILALSTGVNDYIKQIEEETLSEYPLQIQSTGVDFSSMIESGEEAGTQEEEQGDIYVVNMVTDMFSTMDTNDLESLKSYLDSGDSGFWQVYQRHHRRALVNSIFQYRFARLHRFPGVHICCFPVILYLLKISIRKNNQVFISSLPKAPDQAACLFSHNMAHGIIRPIFISVICDQRLSDMQIGFFRHHVPVDGLRLGTLILLDSNDTIVLLLFYFLRNHPLQNVGQPPVHAFL